MVLTTAITPSHSVPFASDLLRMALVQPHPMSKAKVIFLAILVVFFCGLFMGSYIWMRRPNFGQDGKPAGIVESQPVLKPNETLSEGGSEPVMAEQDPSKEVLPTA